MPVEVTGPMPDNQEDFILIDRSGSMADKWTETISGVNAYVDGLKKNVDTANIGVTVMTFDTQSIDVVRRSVKAKDWVTINDKEIQPRSMTNLYDAIGELVKLAEEDNPSRSAIIIVTDGFENASRKLTKEQTKELLDGCRTKGWQTLFLGVDFDNFDQGTGLGNAMGGTAYVAAQNFAQSMSDTSSLRAGYGMRGLISPMEYTEEDKKKMAEVKKKG